MTRSRHVVVSTATIAFVFLLTLPLFLEIYRSAAFNTSPRDDYASYLLRIVGDLGGTTGSPIVYRPLSVMVAIPFYYLLPPYSFTNLVSPDVHQLQATEALAAVSYLSLLATAGLVYLTARRKLGSSPKASITVATLSFFLAAFVSQAGTDPLAILMISLLLFLVDRPLVFSAVLPLSVLINEKIVFLLAIVLAFRFVIGRQRTLLPQVIVALFAVAGYFAIRALVHAPGWENQTTPSTYLSTFFTMFPYVFSIKGFIANLVPLAVVASLALIEVWALGHLTIDSTFVSKSDALVIPVVFALGMAIGMEYTIGRLVMFTYPLYLPVLSRCLDFWFPERDAEVTPARGKPAP